MAKTFRQIFLEEIIGLFTNLLLFFFLIKVLSNKHTQKKRLTIASFILRTTMLVKIFGVIVKKNLKLRRDQFGFPSNY